MKVKRPSHPPNFKGGFGRLGSNGRRDNCEPFRLIHLNITKFLQIHFRLESNKTVKRSWDLAFNFVPNLARNGAVNLSGSRYFPLVVYVDCQASFVLVPDGGNQG